MTWRPKRFRLGAMRERITVQTMTEDTSTGEPNRTWTTVRTKEPAAFEHVAGGETLRGRQVDGRVSAVFTVRYSEDVFDVAGGQVIHNGNTYGIVDVVPVEGGRRYMEIDCRRDGVA